MTKAVGYAVTAGLVLLPSRLVRRLYDIPDRNNDTRSPCTNVLESKSGVLSDCRSGSQVDVLTDGCNVDTYANDHVETCSGDKGTACTDDFVRHPGRVAQ